MAKPHWFPFYVPDFLSSPTVTMMSAEEVGGYVLLLCYAWQDPQGSLPSDDDSLRVLSRIKGDLTRLKSCFIEKKGRLFNKRLTQELEKVKEKSVAAKQSASMRWHSDGNANALRRQCSSQSQSESQKKEDTYAPWQERVTAFWTVYPKKKGKGNVEKWFKQHQPSEILLNTMLAKVELLKKSTEWQERNGKYIPHPYSWLNAKGWDDELTMPARKERLPL